MGMWPGYSRETTGASFKTNNVFAMTLSQQAATSNTWNCSSQWPLHCHSLYELPQCSSAGHVKLSLQSSLFLSDLFFSCDSREKVRGFPNHSTKVCLQLDLLSLRTESAAPLGMMQHGTCGFGGREPYHLFAKTNGIITPICYNEAGPTSTCLKHCMLLTLTWVMIKLFLVYLVLNMSTLNLWT